MYSGLSLLWTPVLNFACVGGIKFHVSVFTHEIHENKTLVKFTKRAYYSETSETVLIREVSLFQRCLLREHSTFKRVLSTVDMAYMC